MKFLKYKGPNKHTQEELMDAILYLEKLGQELDAEESAKIQHYDMLNIGSSS